jgi:hypothetical protein
MGWTNVPRRSSEFGSNRGGWGPAGEIVNSDLPVTNSAVDVTFTFTGAPTSGYTVLITLLHADGSAVAHQQPLRLLVLKDTGPTTALATTGGSTGLAADTNHGFTALTVTAKKVFDIVTDAAGKYSFTWTDTAHEVCYLGVLLPNGRLVVSPALTTA